MRYCLPLYVLSAVSLLSAQPQTQPPTSAGGRIAGRVVSSVTGEPLAGVSLLLYRDILRGEIKSNPNGDFSFDRLNPGAYRLIAGRRGFPTQSYGMRSAESWGETLTVKPGQQLTDIVFRLMPEAAVVGAVTDAAGKRVSQATVCAGAISQTGMRRIGRKCDTSNAAGEFRITGLLPGAYEVAATPPKESHLGDTGLRTTFLSVPSAPDTPGILKVSAGHEIRNVAVQLRQGRLYQVRGKVQPSPGRTIPPGVRIDLAPRPQSSSLLLGPVGSGGGPGPDGVFEIRGVEPDAYCLAAVLPGKPEIVLGQIALDVIDSNADDVVLPVRDMVEIAGSIVLEGWPLDGQGGLTVFIAPVGAPGFNSMTIPLRDRNFNMRVLRDKYLLDLESPSGAYIRSVKLDGETVEPSWFSLSGVETRGSLEILISSKGAEIDLTVRDGNRIIPGARVMLMAHPFRRETRGLMKGGQTDQYGRIRLTGIAPGNYKLVAAREPFPLPFEPGFSESTAADALDVTFQEGDRKQIEVPVMNIAPRP